MEDTNSERDDEMKVYEKHLTTLLETVDLLDKKMDNFKLVGPGLAGSFRTGYVYNSEES